MAVSPNINEKTEKKEETTITAKLIDLIQKNRKGLFVGFLAVVVILAGFVVFLVINNNLRANALSQIDALNRRYEALRFYIGSDDPEAASKQADIDTLIADIDVFTRKNSGFALARAYTISASIYDAQKKWAEAEALWSAAAKAAAKTYLAPIAVFNAAVAAEEQGNIDSAIELYTSVLNFSGSFPTAARAQFSIGRLHESQKNNDAAMEAYRNLVSKWPDDPVWANLAQNRLIVLSK